jgi:signal transduction histidine kinase
VRFDDRLLTVLSQPAGDRHDAAVRWRQLVDLVARAGTTSASPVVDRALETIRTEAPNIDEDLRAAAARAVAARPLPIGLLEYFVSDGLTVSAPVLAAATLGRSQWQVVLGQADEETRRFVEALHPEVPTAVAPAHPKPAPEPFVEAPEPDVAPPATTPTPSPTPSLHDVVARIERRRRARQGARSTSPPPLPVEAPSLFRWECGPSGDIAWVEGAPRGALIGRSIARVQEDDEDRIDGEVTRAFAMRAPFRDAEMTVAGDGLVAGDWKISGLPAFDPTDGRFAGYRGIALRETARPEPSEPAAEVFADPDSLRELVHEIKTPLTAIIGFAEIIEGQYLGPADYRYRQRAGDIVGEARLLLRAIDDLDFAAKVHSSGSGGERRVDLLRLAERVGETLSAEAAQRNVELNLTPATSAVIAAVEPEIAERLLVRLGSAIIERAEAGERLKISLEQNNEQCRISISRPQALRSIPDAQLFDAAAGEGPEKSGLLAGFSLRLVRGLARIAGGDLSPTRAGLTLSFPRA